MKKHIYTSAAMILLAVLVQSCFQEMDHPAFNYPDSSAGKAYNPMKFNLPFEDDIRDKGTYGFLVTDNGNAKFAEGLNGKAYQGAANAYILAKAPKMLTDSIADLGSFTVAFWMKANKNSIATGIFSLSNTKTFWGNLDIYLEGYSDNDTQAFFKIHLYNGTTEETIEMKIDDVFTNNWVHMAFRYDEKTSTLTAARNGENAFSKVPERIAGQLKFNNVGSIAIGAFQFSTTPSLTEATGAQGWASNYAGLFDQFHFYNKAIGDSEIQRLFTDKE